MRKVKVYLYQELAGILIEDEEGYTFKYESSYLSNPAAKPVSLTLPLRTEKYVSRTMFPFFDGLIPEGWLLEIAERNWKLNARDRMGLLMACCRDCIGAVSIVEDK
jgi:serine/threonine-protein kinase HipA